MSCQAVGGPARPLASKRKLANGYNHRKLDHILPWRCCPYTAVTAKRRANLTAQHERLERITHLPRPAGKSFLPDTRNVHLLDLAREVVEREAGELRRRAAHKGVHRGAKFNRRFRHARGRQQLLLLETA